MSSCGCEVKPRGGKQAHVAYASGASIQPSSPPVWCWVLLILVVAAAFLAGNYACATARFSIAQPLQGP